MGLCWVCKGWWDGTGRRERTDGERYENVGGVVVFMLFCQQMPVTSAALGPIIFRTGCERPINSGGRRTQFCRELSAEVKFLDAAGVHPGVLYTVIGSLPSAETDLPIASFGLACTVHQIFKGKLFVIRSPSMRKNSIARDVTANKFNQAEFAVIFRSQKTHEERVVGELW